MNAQRTMAAQKLRQTLRLCQKEASGLERVSARLFAAPVTAERLSGLDVGSTVDNVAQAVMRLAPGVVPVTPSPATSAGQRQAQHGGRSIGIGIGVGAL